MFRPGQADQQRPILAPRVTLHLVQHEDRIAVRVQVTAIGKCAAADQDKPGDLADRQPEMRLGQAEPAEIHAFGNGDGEPDTRKRIGPQERRVSHARA